ncbi:germ cell-specific gene 1-like protein [Mobula hypostoma]|uniref:germ cell-specific gene 1-like protein n=1 Tax=Mobula hypostoma TaxID=723540 RepID=UPI002FC2AF48
MPGMKMGARQRLHLSLGLSSLALISSSAAFASGYWCVGTHRVVKPLCQMAAASGDRQGAGTEIRGCLGQTAGNGTTDELESYGWETGEDRFTFHTFHTGFWTSCEEEEERGRVRCRSFLQLTPESEQGVLWFAIVAEILYITLLSLGFGLLCFELACTHRTLITLKTNSFAAVFTVLSGLLGMVGHMMYTTVFHVTVSLGPKDWKPQTWDYGWSFLLAWLSFSLCMASAVCSLNAYAKTAAQARCGRQSLAGTSSCRTLASSPPHLLVLDPELAPFLWERSAFPACGPGQEGEGEGEEGCEGNIEGGFSLSNDLPPRRPSDSPH